MNPSHTYIALLRGINVGGHHKVPMADLKVLLQKMKLTQVRTLLNSGNIIFESDLYISESDLEALLQSTLEKHFGFPIPVILCEKAVMDELVLTDPFKKIEVTKDTRLYVSFLKEPSEVELKTPWTSDDGTFTIIAYTGKIICSILDLSLTKTVKGMDSLEKLFGKDITTRNWNTILKIHAKM